MGRMCICCCLSGAETILQGREGTGLEFDGIWVVLRMGHRVVNGKKVSMTYITVYFFSPSYSKDFNFPFSLF